MEGEEIPLFQLGTKNTSSVPLQQRQKQGGREGGREGDVRVVGGKEGGEMEERQRE
jgi:hypothetical protein